MSRWKRGDTKPDLVIDCFDGDGRRAPLHEADVVRVIVSKRGATKWERVVTGDAEGVVRVSLQPEDTADVGTFYAKVYAQWPDGSRQHYPPADQYMTFTVTR